MTPRQSGATLRGLPDPEAPDDSTRGVSRKRMQSFTSILFSVPCNAWIEISSSGGELGVPSYGMRKTSPDWGAAMVRPDT